MRGVFSFIWFECPLRGGIKLRYFEAKKNLLPNHEVDITPQFEAIFTTFQNPSYIGELRQRWFEIKKLRQESHLTVQYCL